MTWEVLEPIKPAGRPAEVVVKEAEDRIKAALGQSSRKSEAGFNRKITRMGFLSTHLCEAQLVPTSVGEATFT